MDEVNVTLHLKGSPPLKILMPTSSFPRYEEDYYGNFISNLAGCISRKGLEVTILAPRSRSTTDSYRRTDVRHFPFLPSKKFETIPEKSLRYAAINELPQLPTYIASAYIHILRLPADIVHAHFAIPMGFIAALSSRRKPLMVTCHGSDCTLPYMNPVFRPFTAYALRKADKVVAVSQFIRSLAMKLGAPLKKVEVIYQGVDTSKFKPHGGRLSLREKFRVPADHIVIGTLGRLVPKKRIDDMIKAAKFVSEKIDAYFLVGGEGFHRPYLEKLAREMSNFRFLGEIKDPVSFHQLLDIFVLPSVREGLSISLQEAMSTGCVPVAVNGFGCPELVEEEVNGYLFKPRDVEGLTKKILEAASNLQMGAKARDTVIRRFDLEENSEKYVELYYELLSDR